MKHLFIPYELAVLAKEKGFNENCFKHWNCSYTDKDSQELSMFKNEHINSVEAPIYQQVVDWFREKHNTHIEIRVIKNWKADQWLCNVISIKPKTKTEFYKKEYDSVYDESVNKMTYYEALNKAIEEAFKLI